MSRGFFVSAVSGSRVALLAGPLGDHQAALGLVEAARALACELDPWMHFAAFGTLSTDSVRRGVLNDRLGVLS